MIPCNNMDTIAYDSAKSTNGCILLELKIFTHPKGNDANNYILITILIPGNNMDRTAYKFSKKLLTAVYQLTQLSLPTQDQMIQITTS